MTWQTHYFPFQATHAPSAWTRSKPIWGLPNCEQAPFSFRHEHAALPAASCGHVTSTACARGAATPRLHTIQHTIRNNSIRRPAGSELPAAAVSRCERRVSALADDHLAVQRCGLALTLWNEEQRRLVRFRDVIIT